MKLNKSKSWNSGSMAYILSLRLGKPSVRKEGEEYDFECPWCSKDNGKQKLGVNLKKRIYHCFRCHQGGRLFDLLKMLDLDPMEIYDKGGVIPEKTDASKDKELPSIQNCEYLGIKGASQLAKDALKYCKVRGTLNAADLRVLRWFVCWEPNLFGRVIIPVVVDGRMVQYIARGVYNFIKPKELAGPRRDGWWPKGEVAYGLDELPKGLDLVVVEGIWDWVTVKKLKYNVIALLGSSMSDFVAGRIAKLRPRNVCIMMDGDDAGEKATEKVIKALEGRCSARLRVARPPDGYDPDDVRSKQPDGLNLVRKMIQHADPSIEWLLERSVNR